MVNKFLSLFNFANVTQINNTITINNTKIETSINHIKRDFANGDIKQAFDDLNSLIDDNNSNPQVKYHLFVNKASYLFSVRKYDEAINLIENIEKNYAQFIDLSFEELKLIELSLKKEEKEFFELVSKIISESSKDIESDKFGLMYYLNTKEIDKAKVLFESFEELKKEQKEYSLIGGHIYSETNDTQNADKYYQLALKENLSFIDRVIIYGYYSTIFINKAMYGHSIDIEDKEKIQEYQNLLEKLFNSEVYFEKEYIVNLKNIYLYVLLVLTKTDIYINYFISHKDIDLIFTKHYIHYISVSGEKISHELVQNKILNTNDEELLLGYLHLLELSEYQDDILLFLETKQRDKIFTNQYVQLFYIKAKTEKNESVERDIVDISKEKKYKSFENLIAYLMLQVKETAKATEEDIDKLLEYSKNENLIQGRILETIFLLNSFGYRKEYLQLALDKQTVFPKIIVEALKLCYEDADILIDDFESFIQDINNKDDYILAAIADIYVKFNQYDKAFQYFYNLFIEGREDTHLLLRALETSVRYFLKTNGIIEEQKQKEIYNKVISMKNELDIRGLIFILQYSLIILKDTRQILPTLNQKLLENSIDTLDKEIKIELSNLYTQTTIGANRSNYTKLFIYDENICFKKEGKTYFTGYECNAENKEKYGLSAIEKNRFLSIKNNPSYTQESLFHSIVGPFAFRVDNPNMIPIEIDLSSDNILSDLTLKITELFGDDNELFEKYSNGDFVGLYILSNKDYKDYFTLIPYLLNHEKYILNSLKPNFLKDKKKILTLSSIIFLNEINCLDVVLDRDDIVIQQTLINWINDYVENYDSLHRPREFNYLDEKEPTFILYTKEEAKKAEAWKETLITLLNQLLECEIIDDIHENLPISNAFELLAKDMGEQEYHALAYCIKHNYQIISENNVFDMLFNHFGFNELFISNSYSMLSDTLKKDDFFAIQKILFENKYKSLTNKPDMDAIYSGLNYYGFKNILNEELKMFFCIWYEYGYLNELILKYQHHYKVLYPKNILPQPNTFSKNMDYLLNEVINYE